MHIEQYFNENDPVEAVFKEFLCKMLVKDVDSRASMRKLLK